jgi:hypothetical protein
VRYYLAIVQNSHFKVLTYGIAGISSLSKMVSGSSSVTNEKHISENSDESTSVQELQDEASQHLSDNLQEASADTSKPELNVNESYLNDTVDSNPKSNIPITDIESEASTEIPLE